MFSESPLAKGGVNARWGSGGWDKPRSSLFLLAISLKKHIVDMYIITDKHTFYRLAVYLCPDHTALPSRAKTPE